MAGSRRSGTAVAARSKLQGLEKQVRRAAAFLQSISHEHRLMILCTLIEGERSVGDLAATLGVSQPNVSQHLFRLKSQHLVSARREGQVIYYRLASPDVEPIIAHLHAMFCKA
jgi:ArsR family transcriptional regulator